jgi:hypothetical protein
MDKNWPVNYGIDAAIVNLERIFEFFFQKPSIVEGGTVILL